MHKHDPRRLEYLQHKLVPIYSPWRSQATKDRMTEHAPRKECLCSPARLATNRGLCGHRHPATGECTELPF